ncbi:tRNA (adenosine(37)-N6)-dimethylallyltransferase MiaA [Candidatus Pelagibacter bacterium]|nr:tRNA (adenosine(37)-N6)-dimethylallyltransferase MiaA [Candidatus Pelagibacter bacterium]
MLKKIILLAGPTASGKSNLAIKLAEKINGEIINADSMQIFKEFSILSSRPNLAQTRKIQHHLYGIISVKKHFSAGDWLKEVKKKINTCKKKKKVPIIVGGTGLYFNIITKGISKIPDIDIKTRNKVRNLFKKLGCKKFYNQLLKLDPKIKGRILPTDSQRLQRAYEVKLETKKSLYDWFVNTKSDFSDFEIKKIFIDIPREVLLKKISLRTEQMFKKRCIYEVKKFNALKIKKTLSANKLIGVREINDFLNNSISLKQCKDLINIRTRQYAKRQNTWARGHMKNWNKLYSKNFSNLLKKSLKVVS